MPALGIRNKDGATKTLDINGTPDIMEITEAGIKMLKPLKALPSAAADDVVVQSQVFGVDQSIQGGLVREYGVTYTNSTGKPIVIQVKATTTAVNGTLRALVNTLVVQAAETAVATRDIGVSFVVPPGASYLVTSTATGLPTWREYR